MKAVIIIHALVIALCFAFFPGFSFDGIPTAIFSFLFITAGYYLGRALLVLALLPLSLTLLYINHKKEVPKFFLIAGLWLFIAAAHFLLLWAAQELFPGFHIVHLWQTAISACLIGLVYMVSLELLATPSKSRSI